MTENRKRKPTAAKTWGERVMPVPSKHAQKVQIADEVARANETAARKTGGLPAVPRAAKQFTLTENANLARTCMRVLWLREHIWPEKLSLDAAILRYAKQHQIDHDGGDREELVKLDKIDLEPEGHALVKTLRNMIIRKRKVRILRESEELRPGEIGVEFSPRDRAMRFAQTI